MLKGFYHTKASIATLKVGFESLQRILFSGIEDFDHIFSVLVKMTNDARDQISVIFSDIGKNNKGKTKSNIFCYCWNSGKLRNNK